MIVKDKTTCTPNTKHKLSAYFDYLRIKADHEKAGFFHAVLRNVTCLGGTVAEQDQDSR